MEVETGVVPRPAKEPQKLRGAGRTPPDLQGEPSGLQGCGRMNCCCFEPCGVGTCYTAIGRECKEQGAKMSGQFILPQSVEHPSRQVGIGAGGQTLTAAVLSQVSGAEGRARQFSGASVRDTFYKIDFCCLWFFLFALLNCCCRCPWKSHTMGTWSPSCGSAPRGCCPCSAVYPL